MKSLSPEQLALRTDPEALTIHDAIDPSRRPSLVGQTRAARAIRYALSVDLPGYNLFVTGPLGIGKTRFVREAIAQRNRQVDPSDWVYVNNFPTPDKPLAIRLSAGQGGRLRDDMRRLVTELRGSLQTAFEADRYTARMAAIRDEIATRDAAALDALHRDAERDGLTFEQSDDGFTVSTREAGVLLDTQAIATLPEVEPDTLRGRIKSLTERLQQTQRDTIRYRREQLNRAREVGRETAAAVVKPLIGELLERYVGQSGVLDWLMMVQQDLLEHYADFLPQPETSEAGTGATEERSLARFEVNVIIAAHAGQAPVVKVEHPTVAELLGRIDYQSRFGTLQTDFRLIKPGRLHEANGGYLLIDAWRLFAEPLAWDALKRALRRGSIRIESTGETAGGAMPSQIDPQPIPLEVKVILFSERYATELLTDEDPDFDALFRVVADFDDTLERSPVHESGLAQVLLEQACGHGLLPLPRETLACLIDEAVRRADDSKRLSTHVQLLTEIMVEADFEAREAGCGQIDPEHVARALAGRLDRAGRIQDEHRRSILRHSVVIDTAGEKVGQVNALATFDIGTEVFAHPSRVTATSRVGEGSVLDVQRETHLGGPIHTKGVMILSSFLATRFAPRQALPINATLAFEQSYGPIDGDSATVAECCALISALAALPIRQDLAVTGSMDQLGGVQSVGCVSQKIEGFFDICAARGLTGTQGVIIPDSNIEHLMVSETVIAAVRDGRFHVHAVSHIDEAIELLMGMPAGLPNDNLAQRTVSARVTQRLTDLLAQRGGGRAAARRARYANGEHD